MARPTLIQGGPAFFTPEGYVPPVQPEQAFLPTDVMRDPIADMFAAQPPLNRVPGPPKMIDPPKPPDQIFIDDMPPMREEPPMDFPMPQPPVEMPIFEDDPIMRSLPVGDPVPFVPPVMPPSRDDFMSIERLPSPLAPPPLMNTNYSDRFPRDIRPTDTYARTPGGPIPIKNLTSIDGKISTDMKFNPVARPIDFMPKIRDVGLATSPPTVEPEPMPIENIIMANDPAIMPMPSKMPMLPEPMPMPSPMPIRPRMPMPGPIATPMPMTPTNLQLPQIETQMPMMSLDRGIGSFKTLV